MAQFNSETAALAGKKSSRAGITDRCTMQIRENFQKLVESNLTRLQEDLDGLEPKERVKALLQLAAFVLPKLAAVDLTTGGESMDRQPITGITFNDAPEIDINIK